MFSEIPGSDEEIVHPGAGRPMEAVVWLNEIESAKSIAELSTSITITVAKLQTKFEVLDSGRPQRVELKNDSSHSTCDGTKPSLR